VRGRVLIATKAGYRESMVLPCYYCDRKEVSLDDADALRRLTDASVGYLATVGSGGAPHIVPLVYAVEDRRILSMVDAKPKTTTELQRIRNVRVNQAVSVLVDHYDHDWGLLWWVRADGAAHIVDSGFEHVAALLRAKYPQYADVDLVGPALVIDIERITGWASSR
jgi:PPOX class probable F420-dependent enzyme